MLLTNDKNLVKEFVRINFINSTSSFPNWEVAEQRHLLPLIGDAMYDKLAEIMADANATDQDKELLKKARAIIAPLAYAFDMAFIQSQLTDAGLRTISTENMQAAHRWEYNEAKESLLESGAFAIDGFLKFLFRHKADYAEWTDSDEYKALHELIFQTAADFATYFPISQPFRVFWELRPLMKEVQDFYIVSAIGQDFFTELLQLENPNDDETEARKLIKKAVAQYTILKAIEKRATTFGTSGFTVKVTGSYIDDANAGKDNASDSKLSLLYQSCERAGDSYLLQLKEFLNKNASAQLFATYFNSDLYEAPGTVSANPNDTRTGIIGF